MTSGTDRHKTHLETIKLLHDLRFRHFNIVMSIVNVISVFAIPIAIYIFYYAPQLSMLRERTENARNNFIESKMTKEDITIIYNYISGLNDLEQRARIARFFMGAFIFDPIVMANLRSQVNEYEYKILFGNKQISGSCADLFAAESLAFNEINLLQSVSSIGAGAGGAGIDSSDKSQREELSWNLFAAKDKLFAAQTQIANEKCKR